MDVRSVMTPDPACCTGESSLQSVASMMLDNDCGEIPVVDDHQTRRPIGVITDRDIATRTVARGINPLEASAGDYMTAPCITVRPDDTLRSCCNAMEENQIRRVLVIDDDGRLCGIVSLADIAKNAAREATGDVVKEVSQVEAPR
jgi:CBS domain-containing protein